MVTGMASSGGGGTRVNNPQALIDIKMERCEGNSFLSGDGDQLGDSMIEMNYDNEEESENELANAAAAQDGYDSISGILNAKLVTICS